MDHRAKILDKWNKVQVERNMSDMEKLLAAEKKKEKPVKKVKNPLDLESLGRAAK